MFVFRVFSVVLLVCFMSECAFADPMYKKVGGSVVLDSGHKSGPLTSVTWKHQADLALEWFGSEITCYRTFQGRCNLDKTTGSFTIINLILEDSGKYTPEINSVVGGTMELKVIKPVPKPKVSTACNTEKTVCNLTCNANISSEFGSITYKWKTGDTELSNEKELSLTTKNEEPSFLCVLGNPVSNSASDEFSNPISKESNIVTVVAVLVGIFILLIAVVVVAFVMYKRVPRVRTMRPFKYFSKKNTSKDKVELNGYQPVNVNEDGINNTNHTVVSIEQQPDPPTEQVSDNQAEPGQISTSEETEPTAEEPVSIEQQLLDPPTEQISDNQAEPGQISTSEETEPTAEGPGKSKDSTCDPPADTEPEQGSSEESNLDPSAGSPEPSSQTVSIEQQQPDPPTQQVSDNQAEPGQISTSEETEPTAEEPGKSKDSTCDPPADTEPEQGSSEESNLVPSAGSPEPSSQTEILSPLKPRRAAMPGTDSAES
ncbi:SLAM family member 5-like isoform X3 [Xiphophorus hellerii]|uniref:SLAM family member 5-like isoform X3 n=1 Tax=Xiphophorus hellerii TaxID=8084 RepID=UPI0013B3587A|nr:SLAM family member 5-like isoform X3 [Xiphophorus hellerii]